MTIENLEKLGWFMCGAAVTGIYVELTLPARLISFMKNVIIVVDDKEHTLAKLRKSGEEKKV